MEAPRILVPLIVSSPMFLQHIDTASVAVALPSMAASLQVPTLDLNLVITSYLLSLAVFLPLSAWLADRMGSRRLFCAAILLFSLASGLCGAVSSLPLLVLCRVIQGLGAALMIPVGQLILQRTFPPSEIVSAMVWFTVPSAVGRLAGPVVGGVLVGLVSWHWVFLLNIPFGLLAVALAWVFLPEGRPPSAPPPFDLRGFLLLALGLAALLGGLETGAKGLLPGWAAGGAAALGLALLVGYALHGRRSAHPVIDLGILRHRTLRTNVLGAVPLRVMLFSVPFLLPLLLQLGFGLSPQVSGLVVAGAALGSLAARATLRRFVRRFTFRNLLSGAALAAGLACASYAAFRADTPHGLMFAVLFAGGLVTSLCMVSLNSLGFLGVPQDRLSHATALTTMAQQLTSGVAVVVASGLLAASSRWHGGDAVHLQAVDFPAVFLALALLAQLSQLAFRRLDPDEGDELR